MFLGPVSGDPTVAGLAPKEILEIVNEFPLGFTINVALLEPGVLIGGLVFQLAQDGRFWFLLQDPQPFGAPLGQSRAQLPGCPHLRPFPGF